MLDVLICVSFIRSLVSQRQVRGLNLSSGPIIITQKKKKEKKRSMTYFKINLLDIYEKSQKKK